MPYIVGIVVACVTLCAIRIVATIAVLMAASNTTRTVRLRLNPHASVLALLTGLLVTLLML